MVLGNNIYFLKCDDIVVTQLKDCDICIHRRTHNTDNKKVCLRLHNYPGKGGEEGNMKQDWSWGNC